MMLSPKSANDVLAAGVARNGGLQVLFVGWFYAVGGCAQSPQLIAATIIGHGLVLPPLLLLAGLKGGFELGMAVTFALTDFLFGTAAWYVYSQDLRSYLAR